MLPAERQAEYFFGRGANTSKNQANFKAMGREHTFDLKQRFASNDDFVGPDKYRPKFGQVHQTGAKMITFSPN